MSGLHLLDLAIIVLYLAGLTGIGVYFSRKQSSLDEFFRAGRTMSWLPIGLSLMAALNSGIDYLMQPSATMKYGLILLVGTLSWFLLYPWVAYVSLPFYRRLEVFTAYEYLERRFDGRVRTLAACLFLLWRLGWMGTALYVPCLAVNAATGGSIPLVPMIVVVGSIVTAYTMLGGIKAVIWTDVIQFCIMLGGLAATVLIVIASVPGGVSEIWETAQSAGKTSLHVEIKSFGDFFTTPVHAIGLLIATMVGRLTVYTSDQVMVQRFQTTRSVKDSRQAFVINALGDAIWMIGLSVVGLALFAYFRHHPMPADLAADKTLPHFMQEAFPVGAVGLVIAAIFAASLSSLDSAINSCTAVSVVDLYNRLPSRRGALGTQPKEGNREQVRVARVATILFGIAGIALACNVSRVGDLIEICNKVINSFTGPLFGIFLLGMFSRRAQSVEVLAGGVVGALVTGYVAFFSSLSFMWPSCFGLLTTLSIGLVLILIRRVPSSDLSVLTFREVVGQRQTQARRGASP